MDANLPGTLSCQFASLRGSNPLVAGCMDCESTEDHGVNSRLSCRTPRQRVQIGWHKRDAVFLGWPVDTASVCIPIATVPDAPGSVARICPSKLAQFPRRVCLLEIASAQMPG